MRRQASIPLIMAADHPSPGLMFLGATQQRTPADSSLLHTASATSLSELEWLMNTSYGIVDHRSLVAQSGEDFEREITGWDVGRRCVVVVRARSTDNRRSDHSQTQAIYPLKMFSAFLRRGTVARRLHSRLQPGLDPLCRAAMPTVRYHLPTQDDAE
jgi:hypothetical protein